MTDYETILVERSGAIATIKLNRPEALNAVNRRILEELPHVWSALDDDSSVRVIIVTGVGERAFCAGLDLKESTASDTPTTAVGAMRITARQNAVWKPVITAVNGVCAGGGLHFVADSDLVISAQHATFVDTHTSIGYVTGGAAITLSRRLPLETVLRLVLLGRDFSMDAIEAHRVGLVGEIVPLADLAHQAAQRASSIAGNSPQAISLSLQAIWGALETARSEAIARAEQLAREHAIHPDHAEGPRAFLERRPPRWTT